MPECFEASLPAHAHIELLKAVPLHVILEAIANLGRATDSRGYRCQEGLRDVRAFDGSQP